MIFATLEDETGVANVVVWPKTFERYRGIVLRASLMAVEGRLQKEGLVIHLVAERLTDLTDRLVALGEPGAPATLFEAAQARADEVKRPGPAPVRPRPAPSARHPRNVNPMPPSRDFH